MYGLDSYTLGAIILIGIMIAPSILFFGLLFSIRNQIKRVAIAIERHRHSEPKAWP
jgi:hypothetical protein